MYSPRTPEAAAAPTAPQAASWPLPTLVSGPAAQAVAISSGGAHRGELRGPLCHHSDYGGGQTEERFVYIGSEYIGSERRTAFLLSYSLS